jgi:prepilin-type N-terminal cleavage/methylation domain-containing protein
MATRKQDGFSLLELLITVSIALILCGVVFVSVKPALNTSHVDSAYSTTLMALRNTRDLAVTQGNQYQVNFIGGSPSTIQVWWQPPTVPPAAQPPMQLVITYALPNDVQFAVQAGFPASAPDGFGTGVTAIDFGQTLAGEPYSNVVFMPDGSAQVNVVNNNGNYNSGIVYMTRPGDVISNSRAITVWGATGRIRGWRLAQVAGVWTWVQQ